MSYIYESDPLSIDIYDRYKTPRSESDLSVKLNDALASNVDVTKRSSYRNFAKLLSEYQVYGPYFKLNEYSLFEKMIYRGVIKEEKMTIVPRCPTVP